MSEQISDPKPDLKIIHLLPNLLTLASICAGLSAIRFGFQGDFELAVRLILLACVLDGVDGRLARLLKCPSQLGAELDSLADFVNFGVAPVLIIYSWAFIDFQRAGWIAVLTYAICCVLRLARFNVSSRQVIPEKGDTFIGVPSPAGAILVMLPMFVSFLFSDHPLTHPGVIAAYIVFVGLLMISRVPTYAFKNISVGHDKAKYLLLGTVLIAAALLTYLWATLVVLSVVYFASLVWAFRSFHNSPKTKG